MERSVTSGAASLGAAFFIFIGGEDIDSYFMTKDAAKVKHPKLQAKRKFMLTPYSGIFCL